ncbi:hypothetical protein FHS96_005288 [Sphingomonas zeicaulis]|uniref:GntR family transcriptional regulator n=1 Tax=Sphingomonas zeicaulis TaxID=1632740 RepID=UPI003D1CD549
MERASRGSDDYLKTAISNWLIEGNCQPGARIATAALAQELGVSTTPIREALAYLAGRDIVEDRYRQGYFLLGLSSAAFGELYGLHSVIIDIVLQRMVGGKPPRIRRDIWPGFAAITRESGDVALIGVQLYLSGRLHVVRRLEHRLVPDIASAGSRFGQALAAADIAQARAESRLFHERCAASASKIARAFSER